MLIYLKKKIHIIEYVFRNYLIIENANMHQWINFYSNYIFSIKNRMIN